MTKEELRRGNDRLRTTLAPERPQDRVLLTHGVESSVNVHKILKAVADFDEFNEENDPKADHSFGIVKVDRVSYYFKIDYYSQELWGGANPLTEWPFRRILTIMRADEY